MTGSRSGRRKEAQESLQKMLDLPGICVVPWRKPVECVESCGEEGRTKHHGGSVQRVSIRSLGSREGQFGHV